MEYVRKICPICGNKFVVLKTAGKIAIYCNLECLAKAQKRLWHKEGCLLAIE